MLPFTFFPKARGLASGTSWTQFRSHTLRLRSRLRSSRCTVSLRGSAAFGESAKLPDLHFAGGKLGADFQLAAHGFEGLAQRTDENVRAAFDLGDAGLVDAQRLGQALLRQSHGLTQFGQGHFFDQFARLDVGTRTCRGRHLCFQFAKIPSHQEALPFAAFPDVRRTGDPLTAQTACTSGPGRSCLRRSAELPCDADQTQRARDRAAHGAESAVLSYCHAVRRTPSPHTAGLATGRSGEASSLPPSRPPAQPRLASPTTCQKRP